VLEVLNDILYEVHDGDLSVLSLLDLSQHFDTVDHDILLTRFKVSFGISGAALDWLQSYLTRREEECWRVTGVCLGFLLFILYTAGLIDLVDGYGLHTHLYADDTHIHGYRHPRSADQLHSILSACLDEMSEWMRSNRLQLNNAKTDPLVFDHTSAEPSAICCCSCQSEPRAAFDNCSRSGNFHRQRCHYAVSCVVYCVGMFCCVTTAPQHQTFSVRLCVSFAGRVAGYATSRLRQRNTRITSCVPAPSTSVGAQRHRQTDTLISSI